MREQEASPFSINKTLRLAVGMAKRPSWPGHSPDVLPNQ